MRYSKNYLVRLGEGFLRLLAFDIPIYRDIFAYLGGAIIAGILRKDRYGYTGRLLGMTYHQPRGVRPAFIGPDVVMVERSRIILSEGVKLYGANFLHAGSKGFIHIGANTHVDVKTVLYGQGGLSIGNDCAIASSVIIYSQSNQYRALPEKRIVEQPVRYAPVTIGSDVWIGAGVIILPGVTIGDHAVVGAGAVVNNNIATGDIVVGVPARVIGQRPIPTEN